MPNFGRPVASFSQRSPNCAYVKERSPETIPVFEPKTSMARCRQRRGVRGTNMVQRAQATLARVSIVPKISGLLDLGRVVTVGASAFEVAQLLLGHGAGAVHVRG